MSLGERLKAVRYRKTQAELAAEMGLSTNTYAMYERDERVPDAVFLASFCQKFSVDPGWLLLGGAPNRQLSDDDIDFLSRIAEHVHSILTFRGQVHLDIWKFILLFGVICKMLFPLPERREMLYDLTNKTLEGLVNMVKEMQEKSEQ